MQMRITDNTYTDMAMRQDSVTPAVAPMLEDEQYDTIYEHYGWLCPRCGRSLAPHIDECPCTRGSDWQSYVTHWYTR